MDDRTCTHTYNTHRHYIYSAEYLRSRIRADRERRYACFLAVVHRMQAVFRRRQLLKRRDEERRRAEEAATRALQDWGRRLVGVLRAKQELDHRVRRSWMDVRCVTPTIVGCPDPDLPFPPAKHINTQRHAARCRAAAPVIGRALKRWWAMRLAQRDKEKEAARRRQLLNRMRAARLTIALWCQRHYRGAKARARVAAWRNERRRKMRARAMLARWPAVDDKRKPFR